MTSSRSVLSLILALSTLAPSARAAAPVTVQTVVADYAKVHDALARDTLEGVPEAAGRIADGAAKMRAPEGFADLPKQVVEGAKAVAAAKDIKAARAAFKSLSTPLVAWALASKAPNLVAIHCSMANASWLQASLPIRNPYYGASMLACGEVLAAASSAH